jgi:actin-like ATPase involved in cell morphogenesis
MRYEYSRIIRNIKRCPNVTIGMKEINNIKNTIGLVVKTSQGKNKKFKIFLEESPDRGNKYCDRPYSQRDSMHIFIF